MAHDQNPEPSRPAIRSFYRDIIEHDEREGTNIFNEVIQTENQVAGKARAKKRAARANTIWIVASIVLLVGIFVVAIVAALYRDPEPIGQGPDLPGLFQVDYNLRLDLSASNTAETLGTYASQNYVSPSVIRVVVANGNLLGFRKTAETLWPNAPLLLTTSVSPQFMFGYHTERGVKHPFLVLQMLNLADATSALRDWEASMYEDLDLGFGLPELTFQRPTWEDEIVLNLPVRSLYRGTTREVTETIQRPIISSITTTTEDGVTTTIPVTTYEEETITTIQPGNAERVMMYAVINGAYIIITTSPNTLEEMIDRLAQGV